MMDIIIFIVIMVVIRNYLADGKRRKQRGQMSQRPDVIKENRKREKEEKIRRLQAEKEEQARRQREEKERQEKERRFREQKQRELERKREELRNKKRMEEQERAQARKQAAKSAMSQNSVVQTKTVAKNEASVKKTLEEPRAVDFKLEHYLDPLTAPFYPGNEPKEESSFKMDDYLFPTLASFYPDVEEIHEKIK